MLRMREGGGKAKKRAGWRASRGLGLMEPLLSSANENRVLVNHGDPARDGPISFMGKICRNERYLADAHKMFGVKWLRGRDGGSERTGRGDEKDMTYKRL